MEMYLVQSEERGFAIPVTAERVQKIVRENDNVRKRCTVKHFLDNNTRSALKRSMDILSKYSPTPEPEQATKSETEPGKIVNTGNYRSDRDRAMSMVLGRGFFGV